MTQEIQISLTLPESIVILTMIQHFAKAAEEGKTQDQADSHLAIICDSIVEKFGAAAFGAVEWQLKKIEIGLPKDFPESPSKGTS